MLDTKMIPRRDLQLIRFEKREIASAIFRSESISIN